MRDIGGKYFGLQCGDISWGKRIWLFHEDRILTLGANTNMQKMLYS